VLETLARTFVTSKQVLARLGEVAVAQGARAKDHPR